MRSKILLVLTLIISLFSTNRVYANNISSGLIGNASAYGARLSAGAFHSLAIKSDGTVAAWGLGRGSGYTGYGDYGQIKVPAGLSGVVAVSGGAWHSLALRSDGTVVAWGDYDSGQANVSGLNGVVAVSAGSYHSLALRSDGTVVAFGWNYYGQTNVPAGLNGVIAVSAKIDHNLALKSDGTVVAWGRNDSGENVPAGLNGVVAISTGGSHNLALKSDGTVVAWGSDDSGETNVPAGLDGVVAVSAGCGYSLALKSDGTVVAWGAYDAGQTNVPAGLNRVVAVSAGECHSLALKSDGTVVAWGRNYSGETNIPSGLDFSFSKTVDSVSLDKSTITLVKGANEQLMTTFSPFYATNRDVTWDSSDSSIATVDSAGLVTALNPGIAAITVSTTDGNKTATSIITVTEVPISVVSVSLDKSNATVTKGNTEQLVATVSPANATNKSVSWTSSNPSIATVDSTGIVTALNLGITAIRVSTTDGNKPATCIITVTDAPTVVSVTSVSLNKRSLTFTVGMTEKLQVTIAPANATNQAVTWTSNDNVVATVDASGVVKAIGPGQARITLTSADGGKTDYCDVEVKEQDSALSGDANSDGKVTIMDAVKIARSLVGLETLTTDQRLAADFNGDSRVTIMDAQGIAKYLVNK